MCPPTDSGAGKRGWCVRDSATAVGGRRREEKCVRDDGGVAGADRRKACKTSFLSFIMVPATEHSPPGVVFSATAGPDEKSSAQRSFSPARQLFISPFQPGMAARRFCENLRQFPYIFYIVTIIYLMSPPDGRELRSAVIPAAGRMI